MEENKSDPDIITQNVTYILHRILGLTHFEAILEETEFTRGKAGRMFLSELNRWFIRDALARDSDYGYLFRVIQSYQKKREPGEAISLYSLDKEIFLYELKLWLKLS